MSKPPMKPATEPGEMSLASQALRLRANDEADTEPAVPSTQASTQASLPTVSTASSASVPVYPSTQPGMFTASPLQASSPTPSPASHPAPSLTPYPASHPASSPPASPAAAASQRSALNLARRPFVNSRPVKRLAILLWVLGALLLAGNVALFWNYLGSSEQERAALARTARKTAEERRQVAQLAGSIAGLNLEQQNREVAYLNRKIAERTFSWSLLFDRLAEVLPNGVRLTQLIPQVPPEKEQPLRSGPIASTDKTTPVLVQILGEAKNDEALLQFVDRLFAHPAFADPDLSREEREETGLLRFDLRVKYLPAPAGLPPGGAGGSAQVRR